VVLDYGVPPAAATSTVVIRSVAFPVLLVVSALLRGSCGARRLRSFCFAIAPFRFWLPRSGPPPLTVRQELPWYGDLPYTGLRETQCDRLQEQAGAKRGGSRRRRRIGSTPA
jgi:hypothetical protein